jgi:hypothetical protein
LPLLTLYSGKTSRIKQIFFAKNSYCRIDGIDAKIEIYWNYIIFTAILFNIRILASFMMFLPTGYISKLLCMDKKQMEFSVFCIESIAEKLGQTGDVIYFL